MYLNKNAFVFENVLDEVSGQNQNVTRSAGEKQRRAATYGPFKTMYTCRKFSVRQHRSTRAAGRHDVISTPGGRWISHGCGDTSNVDAKGSSFMLYWERTSSLYSGALCWNHLTIHSLWPRPANGGPRTSRLSWFACRLFTGDLCGCVVVLAVDCVLCTAVLIWYCDVAALTNSTHWIFTVKCFGFAFRFSALNVFYKRSITTAVDVVEVNQL